MDARNALVILTGMQDSGVEAHAPRINRSPENTSGGEGDTSFSGPAIRFGLSAKATILVSSNEQFPLATPMPPSRKIARRACLEYPGAGILAAGAAGAARYLNGGLLRAQITKTSCGGFVSLLQSHSVRPFRLDFVGSTRELSPRTRSLTNAGLEPAHDPFLFVSTGEESLTVSAPCRLIASRSGIMFP